MGRRETYEDEMLVAMLIEIDEKYGDLSIEILKKAHKESPDKFPTYKTFERRLGGIKKIKYMPQLFKNSA
jgi:predicted transcriptional regulator